MTDRICCANQTPRSSEMDPLIDDTIEITEYTEIGLPGTVEGGRC